MRKVKDGEARGDDHNPVNVATIAGGRGWRWLVIAHPTGIVPTALSVSRGVHKRFYIALSLGLATKNPH